MGRRRFLMVNKDIELEFLVNHKSTIKLCVIINLSLSCVLKRENHCCNIQFLSHCMLLHYTGTQI